MVISLWPNLLDTYEMSSPSASRCLACVCRKQWKVSLGNPQSIQNAGNHVDGVFPS
jgi:hypothetical protein